MMANLLVLFLGGVILLAAVRSLRANRLKERYALVYIGVGLPFLALALWPDGLGTAADWVGIDYRTLSLLLVTVFFIVMNFKLLSIVSVQEKKLITLAQSLGELRSEVERGRSDG